MSPSKSWLSYILYSPTLLVNLFRFTWFLFIIFGDFGLYYSTLASCKWPELSSSEIPTHVLLISDPQVQHPLEQDSPTSLASRFRRLLFDINLRKSWHFTVSTMRPDIVIFLGDMLANGKDTNDETEYYKHANKFQSIFSSDSSVSTYYIPGNSDVGMGVSSSAFKDIRNHYSKVFGPFNQQVVIHNHTFLLIDAPGLVDEDYQRAAYGVGYDKWSPLPDGTAAFVKSVKRDQNPLILLSHIPLARPDSASCGPLREKGTIRRGVGHGYQNTLGKQTTAFLLQSIRPSTVFSGDNRDYCEYTHVAKKTQSSDIREVTVKSFSLAKHIRHPGFQLLSLVNPTNDVTNRSFLDAPCTLPDQSGVYSRVYFPFFLFTWFTVSILALWRRRYRRGFKVQPLKLTPHSSGHSTPDDPPESAIWSPYTPGFGSSPRGTLPSSLRTPTTLAHPTYRASRPTTPLGTPLLPPTYYSHDDDDDDAMLPPQYAARKENGKQPEDDEWPSGGHHKLDSETTIPHFTPPPGAKHKHSHHGWSYSWSFVFRGRRRRMTVSLPALSIRLLKDLAELFKGEQRSPARHHHVLRTAVGDGVRIFAVVGVFWVLLSWHWMF